MFDVILFIINLSTNIRIIHFISRTAGLLEM